MWNPKVGAGQVDSIMVVAGVAAGIGAIVSALATVAPKASARPKTVPSSRERVVMMDME